MDNYSDSKNAASRLEELRDKAVALFKDADDGWREQRENALADIRFFRGEQWDDTLIKIGKIKKEPVLTVNRLPQYAKQIENELRQREMAITINATDAVGSDETARIFTGMIKHIEQQSRAKSHYIQAAGENGALVPGFGFLRVDVDYSGPNTFEQDVRISSIKDPFKVLPDPAALEPDFSDAGFWLEFDDFPEDVFKKLWPHAECSSAEMFSVGAKASGWIGANGIRVGRFWYKEEVTTVYLLLEDGSTISYTAEETIDIDEDDEGQMIIKDEIGDQKVILRRREVNACKIKWCDFTGAEVLDEGEWAGSMFPFVAVTGPMTITDGVRDIRGIIRYSKDSQKMLNYMASSAARRIASANKAPWIVDQASIKPYEAMWRTANTENWAYLPYNAFDANANGRPNPAPVRADQTGQIQDLLAAAAKFEGDLKATIGIYDAGLGATPNDQSGVAIKTLAQQGQNANFHFSDNLVVSLQRVGEILIDLIPKIYDTPRAVRIIGADSQAKVVKINEVFVENGQQKAYYLDSGSYGVTIDVGPGYATQKQAAIEQMTELMRINPQMAPYIQDIVAGNMDFEGKELVRSRLTKVLALMNPSLVEGEEMDIPPQVQAQMVQMQAQLQQITQQAQALAAENQQLNNVLQNETIKTQNAIALENVRAENSAKLEMLKNENQKQLEIVKAEKEALNDEREQQTQLIRANLQHQADVLNTVGSLAGKYGTQTDEVLTDVMQDSANIINTAVPPSLT